MRKLAIKTAIYVAAGCLLAATFDLEIIENYSGTAIVLRYNHYFVSVTFDNNGIHWYYEL